MTRGLWTSDMIGWLLLAACLPVAVAVGLDQGASGFLRLGLGLAVVAAWQIVFRINLGVAPAPASAITALAAAIMAPGDVPLWQFALAVSFGAVIGELVFGGWGRNFLSPGVVALAFLSLSAPNSVFLESGPGLAFAVVPGAVILLWAGILPLPVLLSFAGVLWAVATLLELTQALPAALGTLAFIAVFLIADPVASAATPAGRWIQGAMAGAFTALLMTGASVPQAAVFAGLLAGLFAPLVDQAVIAVHQRRRRARLGRT